MGSVFRFKQFEVDQGNCAMKINTDGVLLGGLAGKENATNILDIGTGTGVIALMLAQRYPMAFIDAVEVDKQAGAQAGINFKNSKFAQQLRVLSMSFEELNPLGSYDLIVSNPPFYTNSLHNPDVRKKLAKHTDVTFFERLLAFVGKNLNKEGKFQCIVPAALADEVIIPLLTWNALFLQEEYSVSSFAGEQPMRKILGIGKSAHNIIKKSISIYAAKGVYTDHYKEILQPYFLAF